MPPRPQLLTRDAAQRALDSGDPGRIRFALVEGSPWLDEPWVFAQALAFLRHADPTVRWSAVYALQQVRFELQWDLLTRDRAPEEASPTRTLADLAAADPDPNVRSLAGTVLLALIEDLAGGLKSR